MSDAVLLILRVPASDKGGVAITRVHGRVDVRSTLRDHPFDEDVADQAFAYAKRESMRLVALQILTSDLFHWGVNELILPGPAKMRFVGHIREQIFERSMETTRMLEEKAFQYGVPLEIRKVETRDAVRAVVDEARKDYERIFLAKEKKRLFPILEKTLEQHLRRQTSSTIVSF